MRHCAWLATVPHAREGDKGPAPTRSRREALIADGLVPEALDVMPPCAAQYLVAYLFEIGPATGEGPVTHGEIAAWQANTGITLQPWEVRTVKQLSCDYLHARQSAREPGASAPWAEAPWLDEARRLSVQRARAALRSLAR